jgi:Ribonuclease G/E
VTDHDATTPQQDTRTEEPSEPTTTDRRSRRAAAGAPRDPEDGSEARDEAAAGDGDDTDDGSSGRRRRRRGRRGRGRGRRGATGGQGSGSTVSADGDAPAGDAPAGTGTAGSEVTGDEAEAVDSPSDDSGVTEETAGTVARDAGGATRQRTRATERGGSRRTSSSRSSGRSRSGRGGGRDAGGDDASVGVDDDAADAEDRAVEDAIAKGGTRMAAKRGARRSSGSNGGRRTHQRTGGVPEEVRRAILEGPPRTMLVTSRHDRTQIAVLEDRTVVEHYVTRKEDVTFVGNIYMARVQNVLPGMEAAFLDIGKGRNGVLYAGEVLYDELDLEEGESQRIENALKPGQKVLVQVTKDPMGSKGPRLTMHLSLAGRYMVLAPNSDLFGISRKLTDRERDRLRRIVKRIKPTEHGIIVRTAAEGATEEQITADIERLLAKWARVEQAAADAKALTAVYEEPPLVVKVIRDNFGPEFERAIVDDEDLYRQVRGYLDQVAPELLNKVELYGAPTADARARAAGAPALESPDEAAARAEEELSAAEDAPTEDAPADAAATDAAAIDAAATDAAATDIAVSESAASKAPPAEAPAAEAAAAPEESGRSDDTSAKDVDGSQGGGEPDAAPQTTATTDEPASADVEVDRLLGAVDLAAAAARREELPALFEAYDVGEQLRKAMGRKVWLPSGGYLIIESTEAMKVIDVNTGRFTGGKDTNLEEIVLRTNLEAADEIVRQLRLRDMGGIIVIDFIDMLLKANQEQVVRRLKRELLRDRTKTRVSEVSKLGLVQMTRKNVSQGLLESFSHTCEACEGRGVISELE